MQFFYKFDICMQFVDAEINVRKSSVRVIIELILIVLSGGVDRFVNEISEKPIHQRVESVQLIAAG